MSELEFVTQPTAKLVSSLASDDDAAMAAWVSFDRDSEERLDDRKQVNGLINFLMRENHTSPFEHGYFKFRIDCPIFVAREFHRHRTFSFNEVSGRYSEMKPRFYVPDTDRPLIQKGKAGNYTFVAGSTTDYYRVKAILTRQSIDAYDEYQRLIKFGIAKEVARMALPLNLMTQFYASVDPLNLMKFLDLRTTPQALWEIRDVAEQMEEHLEDQMPLTYAAWQKKRETWREFQEWQENQNSLVVGTIRAENGTAHTPHFQVNTGRSTSPHLHFAVQDSFDRGRQ